jgi:hypothetical protein
MVDLEMLLAQLGADHGDAEALVRGEGNEKLDGALMAVLGNSFPSLHRWIYKSLLASFKLSSGL